MEEWKGYKTIIDTFTTTSGMLVSIDKSTFLKNKLADSHVAKIKAIFPIHMEPIEFNFKYLGFWLKPLNYRVKDWLWLVKKFEKIVSS